MIVKEKNDVFTNACIVLLVVLSLFWANEGGLLVFVIVVYVLCYFFKFRVSVIEYSHSDKVLNVEFFSFLFYKRKLKLDIANVDVELRKRFSRTNTYPELYFYQNRKRVMLLGSWQNVESEELFLIYETIKSDCKSSMSMYEQ